MRDNPIGRRDFVRRFGLGTGAVVFMGTGALGADLWGIGKPKLKISLAQWSLHRTLEKGELTNLDFAATARDFGIEAIEYVSRFFDGKEGDERYLDQLHTRAGDSGVRQLLIMVDGEGDLAAADSAARQRTVDNHVKWLAAASALGCHSIRVNANGTGTREEMHGQAVEGLGALAQKAKAFDVNVIVENHGGLSSDSEWLMGVLNEIDMPNCGTLPDFGNFCVRRDSGELYNGRCIEEFDKYRGIELMMPRAKAVSAKSYDFDEKGEETTIDYKKMIGLIKAADYKGFIGIEYEGNRLSEADGIRATKALLEKYI